MTDKLDEKLSEDKIEAWLDEIEKRSSKVLKIRKPSYSQWDAEMFERIEAELKQEIVKLTRMVRELWESNEHYRKLALYVEEGVSVISVLDGDRLVSETPIEGGESWSVNKQARQARSKVMEMIDG